MSSRPAQIASNIANLLDPSSSRSSSSITGSTSDIAKVLSWVRRRYYVKSRSMSDIQASSTPATEHQTSTPPSKHSPAQKRAHPGSGEDSTGSSDEDSDDSDLTEDEHAKKYIKPGEGTSKSAVASRERRRKLFDGTFKMDERRYRIWQEKVLADDRRLTLLKRIYVLPFILHAKRGSK